MKRMGFKSIIAVCLVIVGIVSAMPLEALAYAEFGNARVDSAALGVSAVRNAPEAQLQNSTYTGLREHSDGKYYYYVNGVLQADFIGLYKHSINGSHYYIYNGVWQPNYTQLYKVDDSTYYLIKNGIWQKSATYLYKSVDGNYYYVKDGMWQKIFTGMYKSVDGNSYYVRNGIWAKLTQLCKDTDGTYYYCASGIWQPNYTRLYKSPDGNYYYCKEGIWQKDFTGLYNSVDGNAYYVKYGIWANKKNIPLTYNGADYNVMDGIAQKVSTKADRTLFRALKVVNSITNDSMTQEQKLRTCFDYTKSHYVEYSGRKPHYRGMDWPVVYANDMFVNGAGNCFSYAAAFAYMAKAIGYKEVYACNSGAHGWAEVNGLVYDPEWCRSHHRYSYYALSYNTKTDQNYKGAISAGYPWQHVKI